MVDLYWKVQRAIRECRPQIIHAQYATLTGMVTLLASQDIPTVVSFGGDEIYGTYRNKHSNRSARTILARRCSIYCARHARVSIVKNSQMGKVVQKWGAKRVEDIPNGVDVELFKPMDQRACRDRLGLESDGRLILFAVRGNDPVKRRDLAEAALQSFNHAHRSNSRLLALENAPPNEMPFYLNACDALLICSNHEGSPNIVKEALACNRPVVATDIGDVRQRFEKVQGLFLVEQTVESIRDGLVKALQIEQSNGQDFLIGMTEQAIAQRLVSLYQSM